MNQTSLHVALISETFAPEINGVANTLLHLSEGLRQRGHCVEVVRPRRADERGAANTEQLLLTRAWPVPGYPGLQIGLVSLHKLLRRWQRHRPDVLYIATEGPLGLTALRAARRLQIPVISGYHTDFPRYCAHYGFGLFGRLVGGYLRWFHNRAQRTLTPSAGQRIELERRGFTRVEVLLHGVDGRQFNPARRCTELRRSWGLGDDDLAVLHVGRLAPEKNLGLLGPCFRALQAAHPQRQLRLVVVGDGPQRDELQQALPEAVFCGMQRAEQLGRHYASGDLFLFPSLSETFGNVVIEAQASGLAVVAYDQAAAAQHIRHGHNGAVASPGDELGFCAAANWLLEDAEALRRVRLNARQHAGQQGWPAIVQRFEAFLQAACQHVSGPLAGPAQQS
ncbi:glycosyltransferase family 1 protein [Pseudomonas sp. UL073]|uniref:Glycosyltransferase family 1 protein n=1 Tax=Zestomonas insulae TaxID=2809017 RepID=A0ABS2ICT9_9GAMM|nr:glycosyltransferase family 1 protein [Pseudomonas insulae]MBM7060119.1 glycosyltransferase family 1 protein [Pseudomonas insulae]